MAIILMEEQQEDGLMTSDVGVMLSSTSSYPISNRQRSLKQKSLASHGL